MFYPFPCGKTVWKMQLATFENWTLLLRCFIWCANCACSCTVTIAALSHKLCNKHTLGYWFKITYIILLHWTLTGPFIASTLQSSRHVLPTRHLEKCSFKFGLWGRRFGLKNPNVKGFAYVLFCSCSKLTVRASCVLLAAWPQQAAAAHWHRLSSRWRLKGPKEIISSRSCKHSMTKWYSAQAEMYSTLNDLKQVLSE